MTPIRYVTMQDETHAGSVVEMMRELYREGVEYEGYDSRHFPRTVRDLIARPEAGRVVLFLDPGDVLHGYALLIPYYSNEFGGFIVFVDELFVAEGSRRKGLARGLFRFIESERPFGARAIFLEVLPSNRVAQQVYQGLGFKPRIHGAMVRILGPAN